MSVAQIAIAWVLSRGQDIVPLNGSVYRHFPSKAALRDAVTQRWLARASEPLAQVLTQDSTAPERLRHWLDLLIASKRSSAFDDPELFAMYMKLAAEARAVVKAHVEALRKQVTQIIADGVARGEFATPDPAAAARAMLSATACFHVPIRARMV